MAFQELAPGVRIWSQFSEAKGYDFNGTWLNAYGRSVLIDPVALLPEDAEQISRSGPLEAVLFTNKDHSRAGVEVRERFGQVPFYCHELEREAFPFPIDHAVVDYDRLPLGLVAVHLSALKTPGETAYFWGEGKGTLVVGDAVIGTPPGKLSLLPAEKVSDAHAAKRSLVRLMSLRFETLVVGDGACFPSGGRAALAEFLEALLPSGNA